MIKRALQTGYSKTLGALRNSLVRYGQSYANRSGLIQLLYAVVIVVFMAGFVSAIIFPVANQGLIVYPATGYETVAEAVLYAVVILFGAGGIYVAYLSGRQTTKPRMVNLYLAIALLLIIVSVFMGLELVALKGA
jgi:amino acid transporter